MPELSSTVVRKRSQISETTFHAALVAGLARVASEIGRGNLSDKWGRSPRMLGKLMSRPTARAMERNLLRLKGEERRVA